MNLNGKTVNNQIKGRSIRLHRNGMEIEKGFHIRVDRVTDSSSVRLANITAHLQTLQILCQLLKFPLILQHDHKRSVFVGNLAFGEMLMPKHRWRYNVMCIILIICVFVDIKELAFRSHFEECGKVEAVRLVRDPKSGLGKGFGYVLFEVHWSS